MDPRDLQGLVVIELGEHRGDASGEERLACAGRPDHEEVVPASGGHFQGLSAPGEAPDDGEIGDDVITVRLVGLCSGWVRRRRRPILLALQGSSGLRQGHRRKDAHSLDQHSFGRVIGWKEHSRRAGAPQGIDHGENAGDRAERAVEPELADYSHTVEHTVGKFIGGHHQAQGKGKVEPRT